MGSAPWALVEYIEAIDLLGRTGVRGEPARAHLLYGEWQQPTGRE